MGKKEDDYDIDLEAFVKKEEDYDIDLEAFVKKEAVVKEEATVKTEAIKQEEDYDIDLEPTVLAEIDLVEEDSDSPGEHSNFTTNSGLIDGNHAQDTSTQDHQSDPSLVAP